MAGIGFKLRAMANRGDIASATQAYGYSLFLVAGPWIFTVLALLGITFALRPTTSWTEIQNFRSVIIYNFCFTLILTGPIVLAGTRYVADQIYKKDLTYIPFALTASLGVVASLTLVFASTFYFGFVDLSVELLAMAVVNFGLAAAIWVVAPFLSIVKDYRSIAIAFAVGSIGAIAMAITFSQHLDDTRILLIFNITLFGVLAAILFRVFQEYPVALKIDPAWLDFLKARWELPVIGLFYYLGIWIDKLIMWSPHTDSNVVVGGILATMPIYDATMFLAQLLAIPAFVFFFVHVETRFYEYYQSLYGSFKAHATRRGIDQRIDAMGRFLLQQILYVLIGMGIVVGILIVGLPNLYKVLGMSALQNGIFRVGLIGAMFHTGFLLSFTFLLYFDLRRTVLWLTVLFFVLNGVFTYATLHLGPVYYGYGYLLAGAISLLTAITVLTKELPWLAYHAFITNNATIKAN